MSCYESIESDAWDEELLERQEKGNRLRNIYEGLGDEDEHLEFNAQAFRENYKLKS